MTLEAFWFGVIAFFWAGYLVLEGFDFGVGALLSFVGRDGEERTRMLETIAPVWDGNEVWLVVAAGATFAAFPAWYATMFSGFYLALLLVLVLLIVRVVSFEWRGKGEGPRWRATWAWANTAGSIGVPFLWGVALAALLQGVPVDGDGDYTGGLADLFSAYTVFAGAALALLCAFHGAVFLTLRAGGEVGERAAAAARRLALPAAVVVGAALAWTVAVGVDTNDKDVFPPAVPAAAGIVALVLAAAFVLRRHPRRAFLMTGLATVSLIATIFTALYPRVLVSSTGFENSLTVSGAASSHYALTVITVAAAIAAPAVLAYQAWTYHVLRGRLAPPAEPRQIGEAAPVAAQPARPPAA